MARTMTLAVHRARFGEPMFAVERGIPMPAIAQRYQYPFAEMAVGESFFIACEDGEKAMWQNRILAAVVRRRKSTCPPKPETFTARRVQGGVRCWRST